MNNSLPTPKHPFDVQGKVIINKEWYLSLLALVNQVNDSGGAGSIADLQLLEAIDAQIDPDVASLKDRLRDLEIKLALMIEAQDPVLTFVDELGSGGTPGFAAGVDFTGGTTTSLTLSRTYKSASALWVAFDSDMQGRDQFSLSGKTLTFTSAIPTGISKVFVKGFIQS